MLVSFCSLAHKHKRGCAAATKHNQLTKNQRHTWTSEQVIFPADLPSQPATAACHLPHVRCRHQMTDGYKAHCSLTDHSSVGELAVLESAHNSTRPTVHTLHAPRPACAGTAVSAQFSCSSCEETVSHILRHSVGIQPRSRQNAATTIATGDKLPLPHAMSCMAQNHKQV